MLGCGGTKMNSLALPPYPPSTPVRDIRAEPHLRHSPRKPSNNGRHHGIRPFLKPSLAKWTHQPLTPSQSSSSAHSSCPTWPRKCGRYPLNQPPPLRDTYDINLHPIQWFVFHLKMGSTNLANNSSKKSQTSADVPIQCNNSILRQSGPATMIKERGKRTTGGDQSRGKHNKVVVTVKTR